MYIYVQKKQHYMKRAKQNKMLANLFWQINIGHLNLETVQQLLNIE